VWLGWSGIRVAGFNIFRTINIHHQELATILLNYHIGRIVLGSMCDGVSEWLVWSGIRVAGFNMFRTLIYPSSGACDYSVEFLCKCESQFRLYSSILSSMPVIRSSRRM